MNEQTDRFPPPFKQPAEPAGTGDKAAPGGGAGEDEGGTANEGHDDHLKDDQKPTTK